MSSVAATPMFAGSVQSGGAVSGASSIQGVGNDSVGLETNVNAAGPLAGLFSPIVETTLEPAVPDPVDPVSTLSPTATSAQPADKPPGLAHSPASVRLPSTPTVTTAEAPVEQILVTWLYVPRLYLLQLCRRQQLLPITT